LVSTDVVIFDLYGHIILVCNAGLANTEYICNLALLHYYLSVPYTTATTDTKQDVTQCTPLNP